MKHIEIKNLSFSYDKKNYVLKNLSLEINKEGLYILMGENGSGKTTFLKILVKFYENYKGIIKINGTDLKRFSLKDISREIAFLESEIPEIPLKVEEILSWGRFPYGDANLKSSTTIKNLGITKFYGKLFTSLSSGEKKRILLGRIFVQDANIVLIDEPFNFLDPRYKIEIANMLKILAKKRIVFIATHDLQAARFLGEKIFLLKRGELKGIVSRDNLLSYETISEIFDVKESIKEDFLKFYGIK